MRILLFDHSGDVVPAMTSGRLEALKALGHETRRFDIGGLDFSNASGYSAVMRFVAQFKPDFVMFYGFSGLLCVEDENGAKVPLLEKMRIPYAAVVTNLGSVQAQVLMSVRGFTGLEFFHIFACDGFHVELFNLMGFKNVHHLGLATSPEQFFKITHSVIDKDPEAADKLDAYKSDISFCGNSGNPSFVTRKFQTDARYAECDFLVSEAFNFNYRRRILSSIKKHTVNYYGRVANPGEYNANISLRGWIPFEELNYIYNASRIVLNIVHPQVLDSVPTRVYDAMAAGAMVVSDSRWTIAEHFRDSTDIVFYRHPDELDGIFDHYLNHPDELERIALSGYEKVRNHHLWKHRMVELVECMSAVCGCE